MNQLKDILYKTNITNVKGLTDIEISSVAFDSREVKPGCVFVAVKGTNVDGHNFIDDSIQKGAVAVVCEKFPQNLKDGITYIKVKNSGFALGVLSSNFFDNPSSKLILVGITGTNGKTTVATLLHQLFILLGYKTGLLSTIQNKINEQDIPATHTTPDAPKINEIISKMVDSDCLYCFMEVSSHAIDQNRIAGLDFAGAIFTNISHDHLDYHKTFKNYLKTKKRFFDLLPSGAFALSNIDDKNGKIILQNTKAKSKTYSLKHKSDFKCKIIENQIEGLQLNIDGEDVWFRIIGNFNAYNLLAVYATAILLGEEKSKVLTALSSLKTVEGRFEYIKTQNNIIAIIDYAHTPDALKNILDAISAIRTKNEQLITVVGAGGDRDKKKRSLIGKIASEKSDKVILTSDNPRSEVPEQIIEEIKNGVDPVNYKKVISITNRKEAIKTACVLARAGDIILVAGKGHEKYQEIKGIKYPFNDKQILKEYL
ncbi:MAG: UDP-N-acetylmuramoyl-L-alanyl-D-glutamate--2,6-diaminopimelate ligase [Bacteroidales bacterium]|nr:UDP-N-acetylmuramoyl-L-alanyl-D-glutamate--2,6-diaminopimelate ligase [Bacteroidales bacterium]